ncbi:MAG TPA: acetylxylan esterase, partial [Planctomycetaceae bacterium]|nr:acetylxylan esterase [Planctomycetaceae bacterium]
MLRVLFAVLLISPAAQLFAQTEAIQKALSARLIDPELPLEEVQQFTQPRITPVPEFQSVPQWEAFVKQTRKDLLEKVVLRGEAAKWNEAPTRTEYFDTIEMPDYRIRKLRYEAVPGLWIPGLLYEPKELTGKVPVVLNVNGHDGKGKAADYKQTRCINQAKRGMIALNLEWVGMGQLRSDGFNHYKMNQLDLCGTSGLAVHYLSQKRGLDILLAHPNADSKRVAVTGLSGGGWQTIFISALDPRVTLSNPVAGYSSFITRAEYQSDLGDSEQTPSDLATVADYSLLTAMLAPHPTLLTNNAEDQCCFKASHAQPPLIAAATPIFELYGQTAWFRTHVNHDPGTHNFEKDNRQQLYKMFGDYFYGGLQPVFVSIDPNKLRAYGLTEKQVIEALGEFAAKYDNSPDNYFAKLRKTAGADDSTPPDLVVVLSQHFRGETLESLEDKSIPTGKQAIRLKDIAICRTVAVENRDPEFSAVEIPCEDELKTAEELNVPLPEGNLDFHQLAVRVMNLPTDATASNPPATAEKLVAGHSDWDINAVIEKEEVQGTTTIRHRLFRIGGLWTVPATEFVPENPDATCVLICSEQGREKLTAQVEAQLKLSHRVIAFDPFYYGESKIPQRDFLYGLLVAATGERNLGVQASQIAALARWVKTDRPESQVQILSVGPRTS